MRTSSHFSEREISEAIEGDRVGAFTPVERAMLLGSSGRHPSGRLPYDVPMPNGSELVVAYAERLFEPGSAVPMLIEPVTATQWERNAQTFMMPGLEAGRTADVVEVILERLPVPGDEVPLTDILAFSREPDTRRQIQNLRFWMMKTAMLGSSIEDLSLEVDSMLNDFQQHMRAADMRATESGLRVAVEIPLEIAEAVLHARPKKALDAAFGLQIRKAEKLEAELAAPGHELSFLRTAARRFKR